MKKELGLVLAVFVFFIGFAGFGLADDQQSALVVDKTGIFGNKLADVEKAAQKLQNTGADVHIWTIQSYAKEAGSLEKYFEKLKSNFPSWQSSNGGRKSNLIVLMISLKERRTGLYYGEEWSGPLRSNWLRIQTDFMNPRFKEKKFADGFIAGISEVERLTYEHLHPKASASQSQSTTIVVQSQAAPSNPTDLSGLWSVLKWGLLVAFVLLGVIFGLRALSSFKQEKEKKKRAQQRAKIEKGNALEEVSSVRQKINELEPVISALVGNIDDKSKCSVEEDLTRIKNLQAELAANFSETGNMAGDPDVDGLSEAHYQAMEEKFKEVTAFSGRVLAAASELKERVAALRDLAIKASKTLSDLEERSVEVSGIVNAMREKGFKVDDLDMKGVEITMGKIGELMSQKQFSKVDPVANLVSVKLDEIEEYALALPTFKDSLNKAADDIAARIPEVIRKIEDGKKAFVFISQSFVKRSWESVRGNGTEAENRVNWAASAIAKIRQCASMEEQKWKEGQELVEKSNIWLGEAESFMRSILSLKKNLERAKANVAKEVEDAESDIGKAWDYIHKFDDDIKESLEDDLRKAEKIIEEVKEELKQILPDYNTAFKRAQEANALADKIYNEAVGEHESAERQRRKIESQRKDAERRLAKAKEYFEDHKRHLSSKAKKHLADAEENLQKAESERDFAQMLVLMALVEKDADRAYNTAKHDVNEYNHGNDEYSSNHSWGTASSYGGSSESSSFDTGGGDSSFGSSDFGSFGGGGDSGW